MPSFEGSSNDVAADEGDSMVQLLESQELVSVTDRRSANSCSTAAPGVTAIVMGPRCTNWRSIEKAVQRKKQNSRFQAEVMNPSVQSGVENQARCKVAASQSSWEESCMSHVGAPSKIAGESWILTCSK